jgi:2,4-dienoyl-CoA reductase-like NADH-dependent reductase (Old Yellow Enzyme family)
MPGPPTGLSFASTLDLPTSLSRGAPSSVPSFQATVLDDDSRPKSHTRAAVNQPSYLASLTIEEVKACSREAEQLFQRNPHVVSARRAAAWANLADLMAAGGANVVADLGRDGISAWEAELGFFATSPDWDDSWPRDRASITRGRAGPGGEAETPDQTRPDDTIR